MSSHPNLTPYAASKVATIALVAAGKEINTPTGELAPQPFYGYARGTGSLAKMVIEGSKPKLLDGDQFTEWLQSYVKNYGTTGARIDYAKLAEQYKIESE